MAQADPPFDGGVATAVPKGRFTGVEEAVARLAHQAASDTPDARPRGPASDRSAEALATSTLGPADLLLMTKGGAAAAVALYASVALASAAAIALQIAIMRIFAVGSWSHFGSLVVSLAMLGFGVSSVVLCLAERWFAAHWRTAAGCALASFGPLAVGVDLIAQQIPFNAIFIISDPAQKWRLAANFVLYMAPFLAGALFLGIVFVRAGEAFGRAYFADLAGAGAARDVCRSSGKSDSCADCARRRRSGLLVCRFSTMARAGSRPDLDRGGSYGTPRTAGCPGNTEARGIGL